MKKIISVLIILLMTFVINVKAEDTFNGHLIGTFPTSITDRKGEITEVYFVKKTQVELDNISSKIEIQKDNSFGKVYAWFEGTKLYVGADDTIYLSTGQSLFYDWNKVVKMEFNNIDTSNVTSMMGMFSQCSSLQNLNLSNFNTSQVINMFLMFSNCFKLTSLDLSNFDTSQVTTMSDMFHECGSLISLDISSFNTSNVTNMSYMFYKCNHLTSLDVSGFNTSNVTNMSYMFYNCSSIEMLYIKDYFDMSKVETRDNMLYGTNNDLEEKVDYYLMKESFPAIITDRKGEITEVYFIKKTQEELDSITDKIELQKSNSKGKIYAWFDGTKLYVGADDTIYLSTGKSLFYNWVEVEKIEFTNIDTSKVTNMSTMFYECRSLISLDISKFDTSNVTDMSYMFLRCHSLTSLDVSNFNTSNVTNMSCMFYNCSSIEMLYIKDYFDMSKVTQKDDMLYNTNNDLEEKVEYYLMKESFSTSITDRKKIITEVYFVKKTQEELNSISGKIELQKSNSKGKIYAWFDGTKLYVGADDTIYLSTGKSLFYNWTKVEKIEFNNVNTSNVTSMSEMFFVCRNLKSLDLSKFDTSHVTNMRYMFYECENLTSLDVSSFNTSNVTDMFYMFMDCSNLASLNLGNFNVSKVTNVTNMFYGCEKLENLDLSKFNLINTNDNNYFLFHVRSVKTNLGMVYGVDKKVVLNIPYQYTLSLIDVINDLKLYKNVSINNNDLTLNNMDSIVGTGYKAKIYAEDFDIIVQGDINGDGKISSLDYIAIRNHMMETNRINDNIKFMASDMNKDNKISALDYISIRNLMLK